MDFAAELPRTQSGERFALGNCGPNEQGSPLCTCQYDLYWTATSGVVCILDSLFAWSVLAGCVRQRNPIYFKVLGEVA
jgi:hypothetical protein